VRKLNAVSAAWHTIGTREKAVTICVVHASGKPGYDIFAGGAAMSGSFGNYLATVAKAPSELQLGVWAQNLMTKGSL